MVQRGDDGGHDIAVPTAASGDGGPRGAPSRSKVSTMIMRPPQQGHGVRCSGTVLVVPASSCSAGVSIDGIGTAINSLARAMLALRPAVAARGGGCDGTALAGRGAGSA